MDLDATEQQLAKRWFLGAGVAAILVALTLVGIDHFLSSADGGWLTLERQHDAEMHDLRAAQAGVGGGVQDPRMLGSNNPAHPEASAEQAGH